jgi:hypothetical protein
MNVIKNIFLAAAVAGVALAAGCHKEPPRPDVVDNTPKRDVITYNMTIVPRAENTTGDTLKVSLNGKLVFYIRGNISPTYYSTGQVVSTAGVTYTLPPVKTDDVLSIWYDPGRVVLPNGSTTYDENGMAIYLDYDGNSNLLLHEFSCRCIGNYSVSLP